MSNIKNIRNFSVIAHIDHGKSTLCDRMLEITKTISAREMKDQVLDQMDIERERGITIKMQPAKMHYEKDGTTYTLNLIDTPGHIDFSYEVSRALAAVEGVLLLVDSTQGVEAQTLSTLDRAKESNLIIIPVLTKADSKNAQIEESKKEIMELIKCNEEDIFVVSGKTGEGVQKLIDGIIDKIPSPETENKDSFTSLVFDFSYSSHLGVILYVRVMSGFVKTGDKLKLKIAGKVFAAQEVGVFIPNRTKMKSIGEGNIGYIVTGIKETGIAKVGDTAAEEYDKSNPLSGYHDPQPMIWTSIYPENQNDFSLMKKALGTMHLSDASLVFEEEHSQSFGRGFRCGFLGMLHLEVVVERIKRENNLQFILLPPTVRYVIYEKNGKSYEVHSPENFVDTNLIEKIIEPWVSITIITPSDYVGEVMKLFFEYEVEHESTESFGEDRMRITSKMPLRELMRNFFDKLKSITSGYASFSYATDEPREASVTRLDVLVAGSVAPEFTKIVANRRLQEEAKTLAELISKSLPKRMFVVKIQAQANGRIIASRTISALRKDVTAKLYGGDITRKMKLREKQKKGKKKMKEVGRVQIPHDVLLKVIRGKDS
ncbi:MAG: translation elongation factor 4 [Candidatus Campbellbacteria bacterium]|nr:translation elongation factor 4 [Candidatus Campbellbacteria bacterium]